MPKDNNSHTSDSESVVCDVCFASLARKADLPRHMKMHSQHKDKMMFRCPFPECEYANLQKCNVDTHIRIHTNNKCKTCPDCEFKTVDPGSLTRHKKRVHGYVPKPRRPRLGGANSKKTKASRHEPYPSAPRDSPAPSQSSKRSGSSWYTTSDSEIATPSPTFSQPSLSATAQASGSNDPQVNMMFAPEYPATSSVWNSILPTVHLKRELESVPQIPALDYSKLYTFSWEKSPSPEPSVETCGYDTLDVHANHFNFLADSNAPLSVQGSGNFNWGGFEQYQAPLPAVSEPAQPLLTMPETFDYSQLYLQSPTEPVPSAPASSSSIFDQLPDSSSSQSDSQLDVYSSQLAAQPQSSLDAYFNSISANWSALDSEQCLNPSDTTPSLSDLLPAFPLDSSASFSEFPFN
ncbi:hypothetical protein ONZ45_g1117 [Pleurotus djamor]|nr:hypothetical protein ONZ45_g1117 [Pleurotus djamor]